MKQFTDHPIQFDKFEIFKEGEKKKELEDLFFTLVFNILLTKFNDESGFSNPYFNKDSDNFFSDRAKEILGFYHSQNYHFIISAVASYLLIFYKVEQLLSDYRFNFDKTSYWDFQHSYFSEFEFRTIKLIKRNFLLFRDNLYSSDEILHINSSRILLDKIAKKHPNKLHKKLNFDDAPKNVVDSNSITDKVISICTKEVNKESPRKYPRILSGFLKIFLGTQPTKTLSLHLYDINTKYPENILKFLIDEIGEHSFDHFITHSNPTPKLHLLFQRLSEFFIQLELAGDMSHQFEYENTFNSIYFASKPEDLVAKFAHLELKNGNGNLDQRTLAKILHSKAKQIDPENGTVLTEESIYVALESYF